VTQAAPGTFIAYPLTSGTGSGPPPVFWASLATTIPVSARQIQFLDGYTSVGDGGGGQFGVQTISATVGTTDSGTYYQVTSTLRWVRIAHTQNILSVAWFGAVGDGVTNDGPAIALAIAACGHGGTVTFPRSIANRSGPQIYLFNSPIVIDCVSNYNIKFVGDGAAALPTQQVQLQANLPFTSGSAATFASISFVLPGSYMSYGVVTVTGLTGVTAANTSPGDWITVSGCTSVDVNGKTLGNGSFTILTVGTGTVTFYGYNAVVGAVNSHPVVVPDASNGSLTWTIKRSAVALYTYGCTFENLCFNGGNTSAGFFNYTNSTANVATINRFDNCMFQQSIYAVTVGGYAPGTASVWPAVPNADQGRFYNCYFGCPFIICALAFQQKMFYLDKCVFQSTPIGFVMWSGSFYATNTFCNAISVCAFIAQNIDEPISLINTQCENCAKLLVTDTGIAGSSGTSYANVSIINVRFDLGSNSNNSSNGCWIEYNYYGGLKISGAEVSLGTAGLSPPLTIGLSGGPEDNPSLVQGVGTMACVLEQIFTVTDVQLGATSIVTNSGQFPAVYSQTGCSTQVSTGALLGQRWALPDGMQVIPGTGNANSGLGVSRYQLVNLCFPTKSVTIANGNNVDVVHQNFTELEITGGTGTAVLVGMVAGYPGQICNLTNVSGNPFTINHEDAVNEATAVNRFHTLTGAAVTVLASAQCRYSPALSRWVVKSRGDVAPVAAFVPPTGTGIAHITAGALDAAADHGTADQLFGENHGATDATFFTLTGDSSIASGVMTNKVLSNVSGSPALTATATGLAHAQSAVTLAATGTTTLSAGQQVTPLLIMSVVTLTGAVTLQLNGVIGQYWIDFSQVTLGAFAVTIANGAGTAVVTTLIATAKLCIVSCRTAALVVAT
jgi:hypothetical protein